MQAQVRWKSSQWKNAAAPFAEETVTIRVHEATENTRLIDFRISILAQEDGLRIGGSDNVKGYGGFSARIIQPVEEAIKDANGVVVPEDAAVTAGEWLDFSGSFANQSSSGFAIFNHPENPGHPRTWILRHSDSMQNAVFPGRNPVPLSTTIPLVLQYRLVIHKNADLNQLFNEYVSEATN